MKARTRIIIVLLAGAAMVGSYVLWFPQPDRSGSAGTLFDQSLGWKFPVTKFPATGPGGSLAYSSIRDPGGLPEGLPVRLKIPVIGVSSAIEDALITADGRMDVPTNTKNVAWFALGPKPGQAGSAVIGGHYGIYEAKRGPTVFYNLDKLRIGDKIYIEDDKDDTLEFVVRAIGLFDRDDDATAVFSSQDGLAHLNLITCEGVWNRVNDTYPQRRVVFTDLVPSARALEMVVPTMPSTFFYPALDLGATGSDVTALQTLLVQQGFLTLPPGVSYGYFGLLTRAAVINYQASVGLPTTGVLGPLTKDRLTNVIRPALPTTAISTLESSETQSSFLQLARSFLAFAANGLIILTLLILILFVTIKITRL